MSWVGGAVVLLQKLDRFPAFVLYNHYNYMIQYNCIDDDLYISLAFLACFV